MNGSVDALNRYDFNIETKFEILALKDEHWNFSKYLMTCRELMVVLHFRLFSCCLYPISVNSAVH